MKVIIYKHDPMLTLVRTKEEAEYLFGEDEDWLEDAIDIPEELAMEVVTTYKKLLDLSSRVASYKERHEIRTSKCLCRKCREWKTNVERGLCPECSSS